MTRRFEPDFWTSRRAAVRARAEAEEAAEKAAKTGAEVEARETAAAERSDEDILSELGLPDPDTMGQGDDFAAFLRSAVPERLRRRALRRLWRSNPVLANLDGLVDHGEDFTDKAVVVPGMMSTYQVGKGMLRHVMALAEVEEVTEEAEIAPEAEPAEAIEEEPAETTMIAADEAAPEPAPVLRRHMRFSFADAKTGEVHS
ncbi:MAG: DUF3306 domain-containing protein [Albidovulum sp.]|uniref:DUF3306 domain-containing protein n=1 Tax=Albidovulum sp. TaxID=1872424 RepID=UPI003C9E7162